MPGFPLGTTSSSCESTWCFCFLRHVYRSCIHCDDLNREILKQMYKGWNDLLKVVASTMVFSSPSTRKTCRTALGEHNSNSYFVMKPNIQCFRKGPQLRTWSSWGPNCWNGPHLVLILNKSPHFTLKRQVANSCRVGVIDCMRYPELWLKGMFFTLTFSLTINIHAIAMSN